MDNYNYDLHAELQSAFKLLGALHDAIWVAGPRCIVVSISFIFHSFRVLFGTDVDLLSRCEWE